MSDTWSSPPTATPADRSRRTPSTSTPPSATSSTRWRGAYSNPFRDLQGDSRTRNWDSERRWGDLEADGQVAEVIFPNTVPPFFPTGMLVARPPLDARELELRWAGLRAHNRWLADWCSEFPDRRAGVAQVFLNDIDQAVAEARWAADHGLTRRHPHPVRPRRLVHRAAVLLLLRPAVGRLPGARASS